MVEVISYAKLLAQDFDVGSGTRSVRLQDGSLHVLDQVHASKLLLTSTQRHSTSDGDASILASNLLPAGARVYGTTIKVLTTFGNGNGLTGLTIGDDTVSDRWGTNIGRTAGTETSQADFRSNDLLVIGSAASDVRIVPIGGTFDGTGELEVRAHYDLLTHD